jgi:hypothetical protein
MRMKRPRRRESIEGIIHGDDEFVCANITAAAMFIQLLLEGTWR